MATQQRLGALDVSFLQLESATTPMHVGSVAVFPGGPDGLTHDRLLALVRSRIGLVPRYRQKLRGVPGHLAAPVWVDDPDFDLSYHVRLSALPQPGSDAQLRELTARLMSRRLDRSRPLWEMYLVEGLADGRSALVTKNHQAMVDGVGAITIATVILDGSPGDPGPDGPDWRGRAEPSSVALLAGAAADLVRRPQGVLDGVRRGVGDARAVGGKVVAGGLGLLDAARSITRPSQDGPLAATLGQSRRYATASTSLDDHRSIRAHHGGTVNDVVLAVVSGALRSWLMTRGEPLRGSTVVRAMVPVSVVEPAGPDGGGRTRVTSWFCDLPVGEPSPVIRLQRVSYAMQGHTDRGTSVAAQTLVQLSGFGPATLHALGARAASTVGRRQFSLVVSNVPGPQQPLYAAGARMQEVYPVVPLGQGQAVSIGVTSYDGGVFYGLTADRDAMGDLDVLAACLAESLDELLGARR